MKENQSYTVVKVIKSDFIQDYSNRGKRRLYRTGLTSENNKDNLFVARWGKEDIHGWKVTKG